MMDVWNPRNRESCFLIVVENGFYTEAIETVDHIISNVDGLVREGGVYNVARRDALGAPFLRAAAEIGIPDHYFQGIGSGTGAIAALEASRRLLDSSSPPVDVKRSHERDYNLAPYPVSARFTNGDNPKPLYRAVENFIGRRPLPTPEADIGPSLASLCN